jgi:L-amino acid N-acyltransferase YncA
VLIRAATSADAEACRAIYAPFVTDNWVSFELEVPSVAEMETRIAAYGALHDWLIAECDGHVAGNAYGSPHRSREAYSPSCDVAVYVNPVFSRKGIGRALYAALLPALKTKGSHAAFAGIALPNDGSIALHEACGFELIGIYKEVGWKMGGWRYVGWWQRLL